MLANSFQFPSRSQSSESEILLFTCSQTRLTLHLTIYLTTAAYCVISNSLLKIIMENKTDISCLPPEMLAEIFSNLDHASDRDRTRKVCLLWQNVIDTAIGVRKWIGNGSEFWEFPSNRWTSLMEITRIGISECFFSDVTDELSNFSNPSNVTFLLPNLLNRIEFDGFVSQGIFENVLSAPKNLTILVLHVSTLTFIDINLADKILCQTVTKLVITSDGFIESHFRNHNMFSLFENFCQLCSTRFTRLRNFECTLPIFLDKEIQVYQKLSQFIKNHIATLKELTIKLTQIWRLTDMNCRRRTLPELDAAFNEMELNQVLNVPSTKLTSFHFVAQELDTILPTSIALRDAFLCQNNLRKFVYICWDYISMSVCQDMLRRNAATLTEIGLTIDDIAQPINCSVFSACQNLAKLTLHADGEISFDDLLHAPKLKNVQELPLSIKHLKLRNVYIEFQDVDWIAKNLTQLNALILINVGRLENLGMTIPCLLWILKNSVKINVLKVKGLNNYCYMASLGFTRFALDPFCPTCKTKHYQGILECSGNSYCTNENEQENKLSSNDRKLILDLVFETDRKTKYIPLIKKSQDGSWKRI